MAITRVYGPDSPGDSKKTSENSLWKGEQEKPMKQRLLLLCACGLSRSCLAASLLTARAPDQWEEWSTPTQDEHGHDLAAGLLYEQGITPLLTDHLNQPTSGMRWHEGVILPCVTDPLMRGPYIPTRGDSACTLGEVPDNQEPSVQRK